MSVHSGDSGGCQEGQLVRPLNETESKGNVVLDLCAPQSLSSPPTQRPFGDFAALGLEVQVAQSAGLQVPKNYLKYIILKKC